MTESGFLNRELAAEFAKLGHTDKILITDAGLALPATTKVIDLALAPNLPTTITVLEEVLKHFSVEKILYSEETAKVSPSREKEFLSHFDDSVAVEKVTQSDLRGNFCSEVKFAIRTEDFTAYSNLVLVSAGGPRWFCEK